MSMEWLTNSPYRRWVRAYQAWLARGSITQAEYEALMADLQRQMQTWEL
jgi:hypothetical protein